jgi:hypothetical protein
MPDMNGFELCEKMLAIDINVKVDRKVTKGHIPCYKCSPLLWIIYLNELGQNWIKHSADN